MKFGLKNILESITPSKLASQVNFLVLFIYSFIVSIMFYNFQNIESVIKFEEESTTNYEIRLISNILEASALIANPRLIKHDLNSIINNSPRIVSIELTLSNKKVFSAKKPILKKAEYSTYNFVLPNSDAKCVTVFKNNFKKGLDTARITFALVVLLMLLTVYLSWRLISSSINNPLKKIKSALDLYSSNELTLASNKVQIGQFGNEFDSFGPIMDNIYDWSLKQKQQQKTLEDMVKKETYSKNVFIASMAHDFKTPITTLEGIYSELFNAFQSKDEKEIKHFFNMMTHVSNNMGLMVQTILDFAKLDSGQKSPISPVKIESLYLFICDIVSQHIYKAIKNNNKIVIDINIDGKKDTPIEIDTFKYSMVLRNLISNANKFVQDGVIKISVRKKTSNEIITIVQDDGKGVSDNIKETLFTPFCSDSLNNYSGSGIGLSSSRMLLQSVGNDISYKDSNKGACFEYTFPSSFGDEYFRESNGLRVLFLTDGSEYEKEIQLMASIGGRSNLVVRHFKNEFIDISALRLKAFDVIFTFGFFKEDGTLLDSAKPFISEFKRLKITGLVTNLHFSLKINEMKARMYGSFNSFKNPLNLISDTSQKTTKELTEKDSQISSVVSNKPILVVDDTAEYLEVFVKKLSRYGFNNIDIAVDGIDALEKANHKEYSLIVMDHMLPGISGMEASRKIKESGSKAIIHGFTAAKQEIIASNSDNKYMNRVFIKNLNEMNNYIQDVITDLRT